MRDYSRTEITEAINEWILNQKHREILLSRMIDGLTFDELSEKYYMSPRQIKRIVYKCQETLIRHI